MDTRLRRFFESWQDYDKEVLETGWQVHRLLTRYSWRYLRGKKRVLDLGCGSGLLGQELKKLGWRGVLIGADIAECQLQKAREKLVYSACILADAYHLSFPDCIFDVVVSSGMVGLTGPNSVREMYRVLKKGGYLAIAAGEVKSERSCVGRFRKVTTYLERMPNTKLLLKKDIGSGYRDNYENEHHVVYVLQKQ